jgi:hypothetical protein
MAWAVEGTDEFVAWWNGLTDAEQDSVADKIALLEADGPSLRYPHSSDVRGSRHGQMRELRVQHKGRPIRVLYGFDPRRTAILLIGGDKTGQDRWYEIYVPRADAIYDEYLKDLQREGLL